MSREANRYKLHRSAVHDATQALTGDDQKVNFERDKILNRARARSDESTNSWGVAEETLRKMLILHRSSLRGDLIPARGLSEVDLPGLGKGKRWKEGNTTKHNGEGRKGEKKIPPKESDSVSQRTPEKSAGVWGKGRNP